MHFKKSLRPLILAAVLVLLSLSGSALASHATQLPFAANAAAISVALGSSEDNTLYEDPTGSLSNGAGAYFFAGRTGQATGSIRRGLIRFDVAASIPPTATIVGATLYLTMSQTVAGPEPIQLHRVTASWGEGSSNATSMEGDGAPATTGDATWIHRFYNSTLWTTPGGDFVATASATTMVDGLGRYSWSTPGMVSDIQMWLNAPAANYGWVLLGSESSSKTAKRFNTREYPEPNGRPLLVVTYMLLPHKTYLPLVLES